MIQEDQLDYFLASFGRDNLIFPLTDFFHRFDYWELKFLI